MTTVRTTRQILHEFADEHGLPDEITTVFYDSETGDEIGYSMDYEEMPFVYVSKCSDLRKIWDEYPDAISWDGWEGGIIGYSGSHIVYNVEQAEEFYADQNNIDISEAIENWDFNVEGTARYVHGMKPYHMYEIYE